MKGVRPLTGRESSERGGGTVTVILLFNLDAR
jgi:hypothetical protein